MARYRIFYTVYKNSAEATQYSRESARRSFYVSGLIMMSSALALLIYIIELSSLFTKGNVLTFFESLGMLSALVIALICSFIWYSIFVKAKCEMILVEHSDRSPYFPTREAIAAIKKNRNKRAIRAFFISMFFYVVTIAASIAICGIASGVKMEKLGSKTLLLSIIGLLVLALISFVIIVLWLKYRKEIPYQVISFCKVCLVPLRTGNICPQCAARKLYAPIERERNASFNVAIKSNKAEQSELASEPIVKDNTWVCEKCKRRNMSSSKKCWNCGSSFTPV